jgi:hypothetical protein
LESWGVILWEKGSFPVAFSLSTFLTTHGFSMGEKIKLNKMKLKNIVDKQVLLFFGRRQISVLLLIIILLQSYTSNR